MEQRGCTPQLRQVPTSLTFDLDEEIDEAPMISLQSKGLSLPKAVCGDRIVSTHDGLFAC